MANRGALRAIKEFQDRNIAERKDKQQRQEDIILKQMQADQDFQRWLIAAGISSGQLEFDPTTGQVNKVNQQAVDLLSPENVPYGVTQTQKLPGGGSRSVKGQQGAPQPLTIEQLQAMMGGQGQLMPQNQMTTQFDATGAVKGFNMQPLDAREQVGRGLLNAQGMLMEAQQAPPQQFMPQAQTMLQQNLPQTPFVPGPGGGFITSNAPIDPRSQGIVPRQDVVGGLAPGLAPRLQQQGVQQAQQQLQGMQAAAGMIGGGGNGSPQQTKGMSGETAGKFTSAETAFRDMEESIHMLFPDGTPQSQRTDLLLRMATPGRVGTFLPSENSANTDSQMITSRIDNAIATKLRIETGVAARPEEIKSIRSRYEPLPWLSAEANFDRMMRLREYLNTSSTIMDPMGRYGAPERQQTGQPSSAQQIGRFLVETE